jgi:protein involved in polysaccharide export with SLBB domain
MHRIITRLLTAGALPVLLLLTMALASVPRCAFAQAADTLDTNARIHVTVAGEPDISGDYTVDPNGDITMLYVNQIHVKGLTPDQARQAIAQKLDSIYRNPQVVVQLVSAGGIEVNVSGAVTSPGPRALRSDSHLNDVLQLAAPTLDADLGSVEVTHGRPGEKHTTVDIDYASFLDNQNATGNPPLRDGDVVYIRRKTGVPIQVNVRGEVLHPGRIALNGKSTFEDAIQQAGGLTSDANHTGITIQHSGSIDQTPVDYASALHNPEDASANPVLLDGDTIIVKAVDRPNTYTITGGVLHPGEYNLPDYQLSLADVLGKAGGAADHSHLDKTTIVRTDATGKVTKVALNASDPVVQKSTYIQPGDNINIPPGAPKRGFDPLQVLGLAVSVLAVTRR